jgi:tRNA(fMet)-specific endonuclease VapC
LIPAGSTIVSDTNVVVHLARADRTGAHIDRTYGLQRRPEKPVISVVTVGEVLSLAQRLEWGKQKSETLESLIRDTFAVVDINKERILRLYAEIDAFSIAAGRKMGKNDLWIAATTAALSAALPGETWLLTCDQDFYHLHQKFISVEYVPPILPPAPTPPTT